MKPSTIRVSQGFQPLMQTVSDAIESVAGERQGFALIIFTEGRASYGSNCDRAEVVAELEKLLNYWKEGMPDIPAHEYQG